MFQMYGLMVGVGMVAALSVAERVNPVISRMWVYILVGSLAGARIYHVIDLSKYYGENPEQIAALWNGGLAIWGGVIGGTLAILLYHYFNKSLKDIWRTYAAVAVGLPLGQAIGRIGNGLNGEFGEKVLELPWWGLEAIADLILFALIWGRYKQGAPNKVLVASYLAGYGIIRFVLEFYRVSNWEAGGLGVAQWMALTSVVIGLLLWRLSVHD